MFIWAGGLRENVLFRNPSGCALSPEEAAPFDEVWFADLCPPEVAGEPGGGKPFLVFDHHLSNKRKHSADPRCTFDLERSGTSLMAHVLDIHDDPDTRYKTTDQLIAALEAYDLGRFEEPAGVRLADIASTFSQEQMLEMMIERDPEGILHDRDLTQRAEAMASVRNMYAEQAAQYARVTTTYLHGVGSVRIGVATSPVYWKNAVANAILARPDAPEVAVIIDTTTQMVSLRSRRDGPDCSTIALLYGGGGHRQAAGFKANGQDLLQSLTNEVFG